ncbi:MAG TPA: 30S ribosomal protein S12 methylthiotransferase RimO [Saprospiraceae bacterium]|nr:30S ribosomal protein S12 methylthiotransferase RimO [Saprospiraceae bacterium]
MKTKSIKKDQVHVITLGCSKNLVDSENLITQLEHNQFKVKHNPTTKPADIIVVNTCGFIDRAKQESIDTILEYAQLKNEGKIKKLYVTGCLSQRYRDNLMEEIVEVDDFFGTLEMPALLKRFNVDYKSELIGERQITTPSHFAYLKISEGCNRTCSFCAIPLMRGKHISQPIESLVDQAKHLAKVGVKEIILIAQELTYYGLDLYKKRALPELIDKLSEVEGIEWIRLHYAYPSKFPLEILDVIRTNTKVCNYLDIPLQHIADPVLSRMKRQITSIESRDLIKQIRDKVPDIALRTTMLVGFPGESEDDFDQLSRFIEEVRFDRLGVFQYSHEEDTSAFLFEDNVPADVKEQRASELMKIQEPISESLNQQKIGKDYKVLFDRKESGYFVGRTEFDSPEVDNEVLVPSKENYIRIGDFAQVTITDATAYDLYAKLSDQ